MKDIVESHDAEYQLQAWNSQRASEAVYSSDDPCGHHGEGRAHHGVYDALVLEASLRQSLVTVRSLGSRGLHVAALEMFDRVPTFSSRWCRQAYICPTVASTDAFINYLEQLLDHTRVKVLITSSDVNAALFCMHRERLERRVRIALAREPALGIALNKEQTLDIAKRLGLGVPRSILVKTVNEVEAALRDVGLPAVVKPVQSWTWSEEKSIKLGCKLVTTPDEARRAVEELTSQGEGVATLFQQYLSGRREAVSFLYAHGQIYARFAQWAKRTVPQLGGTSVLRQSIAIPPDIGEQAERLVREIELEGYSEVEFRRDSDGHPYLMEINPRLSASVEIAVRAGIDFPYLLYQWANGEQITPVKAYSPGKWIRHLGGDIMTTLEAVRKPNRPGVEPRTRVLFAFFVSFFILMRYDYLDLKDPLPALVATVEFIRYWRHRIGKWLAKHLQAMPF
jgi:predicted ATP-grasp superfamily ATP-dependent carboligase